MTRAALIDYVANTYGIEPDHPFSEDFVTAVFRHPDNRKWFAIAMHIPGTKLGRDAAYVDIVNVKCPPEILPSFVGQPGIYPAYHMNRRHWLTLVLDEYLSTDTLTFLLGISYDLTTTPQKHRDTNTSK